MISFSRKIKIFQEYCRNFYLLKKLVTIFVFAVYLFSVTEAHQLLKLPVIFQHYAEHKTENDKISFLEFLAMHYLHGSPNDKDRDRDMQLPFKTSGDCACAFYALCFFDPTDFDRAAHIIIALNHSVPNSDFINSGISLISGNHPSLVNC